MAGFAGSLGNGYYLNQSFTKNAMAISMAL